MPERNRGWDQPGRDLKYDHRFGRQTTVPAETQEQKIWSRLLLKSRKAALLRRVVFLDQNQLGYPTTELSPLEHIAGQLMI
jgi:hypothetical protein